MLLGDLSHEYGCQNIFACDKVYTCVGDCKRVRAKPKVMVVGKRARVDSPHFTKEYDGDQIVPSARSSLMGKTHLTPSQEACLMGQEDPSHAWCMCCIRERWPLNRFRSCHYCEHCMVGPCCVFTILDHLPIEQGHKAEVTCNCCRGYDSDYSGDSWS